MNQAFDRLNRAAIEKFKSIAKAFVPTGSSPSEHCETACCSQERLNERARIARELHDTLFQELFCASMQLNLSLDRMAEDSPEKPPLERVRYLVDRAIEDGRDALLGLRSTDRGMLDLEHALSRVPGEYALQNGIGFRVVVNGEPKPLKPAVRDEIYRISREALVNAFRHSKATDIEVEAEYSARCLGIVIRDNGCGIDPGVVRSGKDEHWGLIGMRERAGSIGARLRVWSSAGAGTEIEVSVPANIAFDAGSALS